MTIQGEVMAGTILQQSFVVEYIVNHQMCDDCRRVEAKDTWNASVSFTIEYSQCFLSWFFEITQTHNLSLMCAIIYLIILT